VVVLALVVLLTGLVVTYFSRSMWDRQMSNSSLHQALADDLARSALDIVTGDLKQEMAEGSMDNKATVDDVTIYTPDKPEYIVPVRNTPTNPTPALLRISGTTSIAAPGADHPASGAISTAASANGRSITPARWNKHYLLPLADPAKPTDTTPVSSGTTAFTPPSWVYVTGTGPVTLTVPDKSVIGRYAYAIYDEGALLDVNVAGFPRDTATTTMPTEYSPKGALAFADLTQLKDSGGNPLLTQAGVNNLVGWRNYASLRNAAGQPSGAFPALTFTDSTVQTPYKNFVFSNTNGFLKVSGTPDATGQTDQAFLSRQDLISFCLASGTANFNPNALQYLGTFSRALNAPSWSPTATTGSPTGNTIDYAGQADASSSANRNLANVRVQTAFTRPDGSAASTGEPLLKTRFPLSRLALVTDSATAAAGSDIEKYFGLTRATAGGTAWTYRSGAATILTLDQVAQAGREPDFFELLKAAILNGSLGKYSETDYSLVTKTFDQNKDAQIIQIGANLLDQYDGDNDPTPIKFATLDPVYGLENLPYIDHVYGTIFRPNRGDPQYPTVEGWLQFGLWNPHANASTAASSNFRILGTDGKLYLEASNGPNYYSPQQSLAGQSLEFTATGADFAEPRLLVPGTSMTGAAAFTGVPITAISSPGYYFGAASQPSYAPSTTDAAQLFYSPCYLAGFYAGSLVNPNTGDYPKDKNITGVATDPNPLSYYHARGALGAGGKYPTFDLQYKDASGNWRTYETIQVTGLYLDQGFGGTLPGYKSCTSWVNGRYGLASGWGDGTGSGPLAGTGVAYGKTALSSMDPRTKRGGMVRLIGYNNEIIVANGSIRPSGSANRFDSAALSNKGFPINPSGGTMWHWWAGNSKFQPARLADNLSTLSSHVTDLDGVNRRGDGDETNKASPLWQSSASVTTAGVKAMRPVLLNRPFRSVGEMGCAMRGDPWKSLNFFSADSADAALMDVFSIDDEPVVAGRVSLNTPHASVLTAILTGGLKADDGTANPPALSASEAANISAVILQEQATAPFQNVAELATRVGDKVANQFSKTLSGSSDPNDGYVKARRESATRALADVADTRTWNLLIDVIAQTGAFRLNATDLTKDFIVQGERRYWLHVAIDRFTGEVLAKQLEPVYE